MSKRNSVSQPWSIFLPRLAPYLPARLFNKLRALPENLGKIDGDEHPDIVTYLLQANRTLEPLHRVLVQYMPRYLNELDPVPGQPYGELLEGSFIWADVTGFTALTELLARQGQAQGRELMNQIMNRLFTEILDPLIASGGDLLIFAGDAALVFFPKPNDSDDDILQATRAALRMERAIVPFESFETKYGPCSLTMSAGVERGPVYAGVVGTYKRMELLVSGPGIHGAMKAEGQSAPGQIMLGPNAQTIAKLHFRMEGARVVDDLGDALGDYEISMPTRKRGSSVVFGMDIPEVLETVEASLQRVEQLAPFLPEDMLAHMVNTDQRVRELVSEFRPVAVQFINIVGLEDLAVTQGVALATEVFERYFIRAKEIMTQHEGIISQIDAYEKGFFLVNTFGTPKVHEGTTRYAVSAALQLANLVQQINAEFKLEIPLQQRGGITYGLVFNGEIGAKYRRESVIAGPAVNRAARLMSEAQFGQVILDASIWEDTSTAFVGEQLPAVQLKGIDGPVVIINVHKIRRGTRLRQLKRPLLGRQAERTQLEHALQALSEQRQSSAWMISGETGIGKTSLILDLAGKARQKNLTILAGGCQPHGKHIPLFVWLDLLSGWLDVDESIDPVKQRTRLTQELTSLDMLEAEKALVDLLLPSKKEPSKKIRNVKSTETSTTDARSPLNMWPQTTKKPQPAPDELPSGSLSALLGNRLAKTEHKSEKTLWKRLEERISGLRIIINLLQEMAKRQPVLIILEDVHWLDRDSEMLLDKLIAQMSNLSLMLVLTGRRPIDDGTLSPLELSELPASETAQVAQRVFGAQTLDDTLAEWIYNNANGNPLYVEELCYALQQADAVLLGRDSGTARWTKQAPVLPLSLHELMLARLDELPLAQQDILKRAAVIGSSFEYEGLVRLYPRRTNEQDVYDALERVVWAGFVTETQDKIYHFNHPLMQEAIYTTLSFSQRQKWHTKIGNWLAERQIEQFLELITYHYLRGTDPKKTVRFCRRAGDRAKELGVYAGALEYYEQVLALATIQSEDTMAAAESKADILALQGDYRAATRAYARAAELGNVKAAGKQAIISGNLEQLAQTEFSPELQAWGKGSQAYLLAQEGQFEAALQTARQLAKDSTSDVMRSLVEQLENRDILEPYEQWLQKFSHAILLGF